VPNTVTMGGSVFTPSTLTVPVGTKVTFLNNDTREHQIAPDANTLFTESAVITPGASATITFLQAGLAKYRCKLVPAMTGTINIAPPSLIP
jgi:plastocyanin